MLTNFSHQHLYLPRVLFPMDLFVKISKHYYNFPFGIYILPISDLFDEILLIVTGIIYILHQIFENLCENTGQTYCSKVNQTKTISGFILRFRVKEPTLQQARKVKVYVLCVCLRLAQPCKLTHSLA